MPSGLDDYVAKRLSERDRIPSVHRDQLDLLVEFVTASLHSRHTPRLVFICTHNSRRSQMAQVWAQVAAHHFSVSPIEAYSAGTEATAVNERAVAALRRAGCPIERRGTGDNPVYACGIGGSGTSLTLFSKELSDPSLPKRFAAVMTCSAAEGGCPVVHGARVRVTLPYDDPKAADGTAGETATYDECCQRISRDLLYLLASIKT